MRPSSRRFRALRTSRLEQIEPRLLMSGDPVGDFFVDYFVESGSTDQIDTSLADAHDLTGWNEVQADYGFTGAGQTVAVIDTGIAYDHVALGGGLGADYRVVGGYDFTEEQDADPYDDGPYGSHGTHVAGIIGGEGQYDTGVASGVDLVALRVFNDEGAGRFSWLEDALAWVHTNRNAFENPITTVNLSLGASWNSDTLPSWAMLEDEFAQLEADGIFIAVAAGNSFARYQETGLAYPAVSSHVVPVASVDDNGAMSYFSQRNQRVIAAPGRSISSTVPDYVGDFNGINDDYARYSGTSMAAPYVAGAAVLLREAYEFVGVENVTQDTIYELMQNTADTVLDPATRQTYNRLNLERAIDTIMPDDDFGSNAQAAFNLGTLTDGSTLDGTVERLDDSDWFSFTAAQSGKVTLSVNTTHDMLADWQLGDGLNMATLAGDGISLDVVAGETYTIGLGTQGGLGHYSIDVGVEGGHSQVEWGTVAQQQFLDNQIDGTGQWFAFTAANHGIMTAEALFAHADGNVNLQLFNGSGQLLATANGTIDGERIDVNASAGDRFVLHASTADGGSNEVDFRLTNLVSQVGSTVNVQGTAGNDIFNFTAGDNHRLTINGVAYQFDAAAASTFGFNGFGGSDTATLTGTAGNDSATLRVGSVALAGSGYQATASGVETIVVRGGGGTDVAKMYDSAGDDTFVGTPTTATFSGAGFQNTVEGFRYVHAYSNSTGNDVARLYDSAGNDRFVAEPIQSRLYGSDFYLRVKRFEDVHAYAGAGGIDAALMYDSAGDDTLVATPSQATLSGQRSQNAAFQNAAEGFRYVHAYANSGGTDVANMYGSAGNDVFVVTPKQSRLYGSDFYVRAKRFDRVDAHAGAGGVDVAKMYDSAGDDLFIVTPDESSLSGNGFHASAKNFRYVHAYAGSTGTDVARFYDSGGDDLLVVTDTYTKLYGSDYFGRAKYFEEVYANGQSGGSDTVRLHDSAVDDHFQAAGEMARFSNDDLTVALYGFEYIRAHAENGGTNSSEIAAVDYIIEMLGQWN